MAPKRQAPPSRLRQKSSRPALSRLCSQCSEIDFDAMFRLPWSSGPQYEETITLKPHALANDSCVFCKFLASLGPFESSANGYIQLQISDADLDHFPLLRISDANVLKVQCHNSFSGARYFASQSHPQTPTRRIESDRIDYEVVQEWLQICQELHPDRCNPRSWPISSLRLIDCETRTIVPASNQEYVTLSYLWGTDETESLFTGQLPLQLPRTIEDALVVTLELGFRYLWIDRYCINQGNKSETATQLQAMGSIYRNSQLTIIAAAGDDPSYGLPGVGNQRRQQQSEAQIGQSYLRGIQRIDQLVNSSRWNSRGWTYQEGILATRRLIFNTCQTYFECHGMCCYEALSLPYKAMHDLPSQKFEERYYTIPPGKVGERIGMFPTPAAYSGRAYDVYIHIARYSLRNLSHDADRLKAFLGILGEFGMGKYGMWHLWGVPILGYMRSKSQLTSMYTKRNFLLGLMWTHKFRDRNIRIEGLPSWSWCGVLGGVEWDYGMGEGTFMESIDRGGDQEGGAEVFEVDVRMER
ncbi:heterokaryon incompatibility protein-domain-containing protein [Rhexocercosporidium sp. MPI-PUGE-AT-0058]|nr:heterokaryon incompatibility protein-domain-containing protein [Rhexocercosporidium sp. MPI-PUGE-AT-0058]